MEIEKFSCWCPFWTCLWGVRDSHFEHCTLARILLHKNNEKMQIHPRQHPPVPPFMPQSTGPLIILSLQGIWPCISQWLSNENHESVKRVPRVSFWTLTSCHSYIKLVWGKLWWLCTSIPVHTVKIDMKDLPAGD